MPPGREERNSMKTIPVKIRKRTFAMAFTLDALAELQELIPDFNLADVYKYPRTPRGLADMLFVLCKYGEQLEGRALDVDRAWFGSLSPAPARCAAWQVAVFETLNAAMEMESEEDEKNDEVDLVLEELKKKEGKAASPTAGS